MGVFATFCQLCGLPVNHDHYVTAVEPGMLEIYRGGAGATTTKVWASTQTVFPFKPEHAWLLDCVGVPTADGSVLRGEVHDGELVDATTGTTGYLADGLEDYLALHGYCWELEGKPQHFADCVRTRGQHDAVLIAPSQQQLFDFAALCADAKEWMLMNPASASGTRNRERMERMLRIARRSSEATIPPSVSSILAADRDWTLASRGVANDLEWFARYRRNARPGLDTTGYPIFVCFMKEHDAKAVPTGQLLELFHNFEIALKQAAEHDGAAILLSASISRLQAQYVLYCRDEQELRARIDALPNRDTPRPAEYEVARDPSWQTYFNEMWFDRPTP